MSAASRSREIAVRRNIVGRIAVERGLSPVAQAGNAESFLASNHSMDFRGLDSTSTGPRTAASGLADDHRPSSFRILTLVLMMK